MAREASVHYEKDLKECYEDYGHYGKAGDDKIALASCLAESQEELRTGLYSGFRFPWKEGEFWSYKGYWRGDAWWLILVLTVPPLLVYAIGWAVAALYQWIWRGFRSSSPT